MELPSPIIMDTDTKNIRATTATDTQTFDRVSATSDIHEAIFSSPSGCTIADAILNMNTTHNKLYFSKFEESSPTKVTAGTQWHTTCRWTFVPDYEVDAEG